MTLTQLKIFVTVAELGSVTKAAKMLGITQSNASAAIAALENIYQVSLFDRIGRSIETSQAGQKFLPDALNVLASARSATIILRQLAGKTAGKLNIVASQTIANYWLPQRLTVFHSRNPDILLNVKMSNTQAVESAIIEGTADIGFVEGHVASPHIKLIHVDYDQPVLVVSAKRWPSLGLSEAPIEIGKLPWIVREPGSGTRKLLEDLVIQNSLHWDDLNVVLELPSNESVKEAVETGAGATLISRYVVKPSIENGKLRAVSLNLPPRSFRMVLHKHRPDSSAARALIEMVSEQTEI